MRLPPLEPLREKAWETLGELADALVPKAAAASPELDVPTTDASTVDRRANNGNGNDKANGNGNGRGNNGKANGVENGSGNGNSNTSAASAVSDVASPATTPPANPTSSGSAAATADTGSGSGNGGGAVSTPVNGATPTRTANAGGSTPTQASADGGSSPVVQVQSADFQSTAGAAVTDGARAPGTTQNGPSPTPVVGATAAATTSGAFTGNGVSSTNWGGLAGSEGSLHGSGTIGKGDAANAGRNNEGSGSGGGSSSMPGIVGGLVAFIVILLLLLALLLYKYRYKRRVQDFLSRFTPFKMAPYTQLEKKPSSIGQDLLFTEGCQSDSLMVEIRTSGNSTTSTSSINTSSINTSSIRPALAAHPSPPFNATRPLSPPFNTTRPLSPPFNPTRPLSPPFNPTPPAATLNPPFQVSPLTFISLQSPAPTATSPLHRRTSADSLISTASSGIFAFSLLPTTYAAAASRRSSQDSITSGVSVASSGIFSPSMLSWPMPPPSTTSSKAVSVATSPPPTRGSSVRSLEGLAAKYKPLTPTRLGPPLSVMPLLSQPVPGVMPVPPAQVVGAGKVGGLLD